MPKLHGLLFAMLLLTSCAAPPALRPLAGTSFGVGGSEPTWFLAPGEGRRPLLVVVQGSGCEPLFSGHEGVLHATAGQDIVYALARGRFAVLVVEKPGITGSTQVAGTADGCGPEFRRRHALNAWVQVVGDAIDAAKRLPTVDRDAPVRVVGLSEGAITAARLARRRSDIGFVGFISGFGCDQWRDMLVVARRQALASMAGRSPADQDAAVRAAVDAAERGLQAVSADPTNPDRVWEGQTHLYWSTFGRACPAEDLASSHARVYVAYGTDDEQVDSSGVEAITAACLHAGTPVVVRRVLGGNHVLDTPGSPPFSNLLDTFRDVLDWMEPGGIARTTLHH